MSENKHVIITGANSGLGFETAKTFAEKGMNVILAVRNKEKGYQAEKMIKEVVNNAKTTVMELDLADLNSIEHFTEQYNGLFNRLDVLINNAGVMMPPFQQTKNGFELQFGSNHLGHFSLTGHLLPNLLSTPDSRIVTLSSIAHRGASIDFDNLDGSKGYNPGKFYGQSKLANLLFSYELDKRLKKYDANTMSIACHPGISSTNLFTFGKKETPWYAKFFLKLVSQSAAMGALPTIYAATNEELKGGEYIGPDGAGNRKGHPAIDLKVQKAYNDDISKKLWDVSEQLTGTIFSFEK